MNLIILLVLCFFILTDGKNFNKSALIKNLKIKKRVKEGSMRLVGGRGKYEGNVEIFHQGRWGNICDDEWDTKEANIVCTSLGFKLSKPTLASHFGEPRFPYLMDNLYCSGYEKNLHICRFDGWGIHDCSKDEAAGVVCMDTKNTREIQNRKNTNQKIIKDTVGEYYKNIMVRLVQGRNKYEGRVVFKTDSNQDWGIMCGDGWRLVEANVVCRQLGLGFAISATQNHFTEGNVSNIRMSGVECIGNEKTIKECKISDSFYCPGNLVAGAICEQKMADLSINMAEIEKSAFLEDRPLYLLQCAMEENCLASSAYTVRRDSAYWHLETRRLLRFTAKTTNIGNEHFKPILPKHLWEFHQCHMHYHSMEVFATFDVINEQGLKVAEGHKASFCLEDNECSNARPQYSCANYGDQGISPNCSDIYANNIDCQWVDISDIDIGEYYFRVKINPEFKIPEMRYDNNEVTCNLLYTPSYARVYNCVNTINN